MNQNPTEPAGSVETLADVPEHILKGLPEEVRLLPSAVDKTRLGVWATKPICRGKKFGPFVGDKKKRSQVKSNVYMWEVYYPNLGWMCVDATDPEKGNWLRYVNWARSGKEQNLFPLEINRTIYYKTLKGIEAGEELLVWSPHGEQESPAVAAALQEEEEERRRRENTVDQRRRRRKRQRQRQQQQEQRRRRRQQRRRRPPAAPLQKDAAPDDNHHHRDPRGGGKKKSQEAKNKGKKTIDKKPNDSLDLAPADMRESREDHKQKDEMPSVSAVLSLEQTAVIQEMVNQDMFPDLVISTSDVEPNIMPEDNSGTRTGASDGLEEQQEEEEEEEEEEGSEGGEDQEADIRKEEEEEVEEEEEEEGGEEDVALPKESPGGKPVATCEDRLGSVEEQSSLSEDSPESSPKKRPSVRFPKARGTSNGSIQAAFMFPCQHCERKFTTKQGLERHMHIHLSAVSHTFKCRYCGKAFGTQINRRRHERRHEAGPKRRPFLLLPSAQPPGGSSRPKNQSPAGEEAPEEASARPGTAAAPAAAAPAVDPEKKVPRETRNPPPAEESKEPKETHPCKYCRKVFGTHTNMRRHQRRVHERHLIPRGVKRKPEEPHLPTEQTLPAPNAYVASTDLEEEGETDDVYIMDVSSNISENLNYYMDGKIQSNSTTSNCDVIEVESSSTELYGINCLVSPVTVEIAPNVKATPVHLAEALKELPGGGNAEPKKRRTASPPLLPKIKTEIDPEPVTSLCSLTIPLAISTTDSLPFPKEKNIYLSSKLKQLLQTQDGSKGTPSPPPPSSDMPKLGHPAASSPLLPISSSRFKRRTGSPPSSPQHSPALRDFGRVGEGKATWNEAVLGSKIPKLESHSSSPAWSLSGREEKETASPLSLEESKAPKDWVPGPPFGNVCNQQPLDLSSSMKQRAGGKNRAQGPWESVLDLSLHKKPCGDGEAKEGGPLPASAGGSVKKKPTTSMLQKVLLNEYNGTGSASENAVSEAGPPGFSPGKMAGMHLEPETDDAGLPPPPVAESGFADGSAEKPPPPAPALPPCQVPPLRTPTNSPSPPPCLPRLKVPTPPPPLLPTGPSPLPEEPVSTTPSSCPSPLSNTTAPSPLPVLSPPASASPVFSTEPLSCASPGPPNLSSSSSSFSPSSSSPSSSSSSPSPPPLSVISSVLSLGDNLESSVPIMSFKQEETDQRHLKAQEDPHVSSETELIQESFNKNFVCNVCESPFLSIKDLTKHLTAHAEEWPFKCEFCVQLFRQKTDLSEHRFLLHGVGTIFVCSLCKKEFAFLCNLQQHQRDLHPDQECTHHEFESGTLRPQNFTDPTKARPEHMQGLPEGSLEVSKEEEEDELNDSSEELYTTIKIMAAGVKSKNPDVRMGLNQHYPSFKPPPFQYHHRNPNGIGITATNFTTHNIPQTFTTAIRCTKCGKSVDNMPELHKHILACASASDKKRYTPKKNPVPLKQTIQPKNGVVLPAAASGAFRRTGQPKRLSFSVEAGRMSSHKLKISALKKKKQLVQKAILQKKKSQQKAELWNSSAEPSSHICPYCNREFTYIGSLNKHASYSCPKKPISPSSKKKTKKKSGAPLSSNEKKSNQRRRTADAEIKMQSTQAQLGKTRARSSGPTPVPSPSTSFKVKPSLKFVPSVKSKKPSPPASATRNASPVRVTKTVPADSKKPKGLAKSGSSELSGKASCKLHVRIQKAKGASASKSAGVSKKADRFSMKTPRERVGGPVTRSLQQATSTDPAEKRDETNPRPEAKDFRNLL